MAEYASDGDEVYALVKANPANQQYKDDKRQWVMMAIYAMLLSLSMGGLGTIGVSVDSAKAYYNVSGIVFNSVYYLSYVDFLIGMAIAWGVMQRWGLRPLIIAAACAMVSGFFVQCFYRYNFWIAVAGGMLVDMCRAVIWLTAPVMIPRWFSVKNKAIVYQAIFFTANVFSIVILLVIRLTITTADQFHDNFLWFVIAFLAAAAVALVMTGIAFEERPPAPPGPQTSDDDAKRQTWCAPVGPTQNYTAVAIHIAAYIISVMPTWSVSTLMLALMNDRNYSNSDITIVAVLGVVCALPAYLLIGVVINLTRQYRVVVVVMVALTTLCYLGLVLLIDDRVGLIVFAALLSFTTGAYSVTFIECTTELAFPTPERHISMRMLFWAQLSGGVGTALASIDVVQNTALWVFFALYAAVVILLLAGFSVPVRYKRIEAMEEIEGKRKKQPDADVEVYPLRRP
jgi:hypothetical protein